MVDQIYRTRKKLSYCRKRGIRMAGPLLGRPRKDMSVRKEERKLAYRDNTDRIAVERAFALAKHSYGLGFITAKLEENNNECDSHVSARHEQRQDLGEEDVYIFG